MKIGDRVELTFNGETLYGTIEGEVVPKCRCKGRAKWKVRFDGYRSVSRVPKNGNLKLLDDNKLLVREGGVGNFR